MTTTTTTNAIQSITVTTRPLKGSRISTFYPVKSVPPLGALESAFQLQEYISLLIRADVHDVENIVSIPGRSGHGVKEKEGGSEGEEKEGKEVPNVDEACWIYEHLRRLAQDLSHPLITTLQQECTRQTCPEMKAGEWLYLCVAHGNDGAMEQCCAIDYILHTLDSATALLNSPRAFPSRLSIPSTSIRHFSSLARRLSRIFAHAYYHHREAFEQAEAESSLYARFLALTFKFELVPAEFIVIPPRMSGIQRDIRREAHVSEEEEGDPRNLSLGRGREWLTVDSDSESVVDLSEERPGRGISPILVTPGSAGLPRNPSPRKVGRSRTDTMVHSEAMNVVEELNRLGAGSMFTDAGELDAAIAQERFAGVSGSDLPPQQEPEAKPPSPPAPEPPKDEEPAPAVPEPSVVVTKPEEIKLEDVPPAGAESTASPPAEELVQPAQPPEEPPTFEVEAIKETQKDEDPFADEAAVESKSYEEAQEEAPEKVQDTEVKPNNGEPTTSASEDEGAPIKQEEKEADPVLPPEEESPAPAQPQEAPTEPEAEVKKEETPSAAEADEAEDPKVEPEAQALSAAEGEDGKETV